MGRTDWPCRAEGIELRLVPNGLWLSSTEYGAGPIHVSIPELRELGLSCSWLGPPSRVRHLAALEIVVGREDYGPSFTDPEWAPPEGESVGDFLLAPVREGLDIWVNEYRAVDAVAPWDVLERIGIRHLVRGAG